MKDLDVVHLLGRWSAGSGPAYRGLANALRSAIERGDLAASVRLPAERRLARCLAVSRTTVVSAYEILRHEGLLESRQGSGTRVRGAVRRPLPFAASLAGPAAPSAAERASSFRRNPVYRSLVEDSGGTIEFLGSYLPGDRLVSDALLKSKRSPLAEIARLPGYLPLGLPALRKALAAHVTGWGLPCTEAEILVTSGAQQAIALAAGLFLRPGDAVVLENPTYLGAIDIFSNLGAHLVPLPVGEDGARVDLLRDLIARAAPRLIYLVPSFHNPTGTLLSETARRAVARLADESKIPIVEDNTLADLSLGRKAPPPIAAFAREGTVLTIGSLSKLFWGGLRVGWIRAREEVLARLVRLKIVADMGSSVISQAAAVRLLESAETITAERREEVGRRLELLTGLLQRRVPEWTWTRPRGGLSLWVRLPHGDADQFAQVALRHGVSVVPGTLASPDSTCAEFLRLPCVLEPGPMKEGVERLARAWAAYSPARRSRPRRPDVLV